MTRSLVDTVVVGFDGSQGGIHALEWAARDAQQRGLRLHVIHVWQPPPLLHPGFPKPAMPDTTGVLDEAVTRVGAVAPGLKVRVEPLPAPVALALVDASTEADTVVVGARGHRRRGTRGFGSTAWQVATHALCPVVVVPEPGAASPGRGPGDPEADGADRPSIVVGLDGSRESDHALRYAVDRAERTGAELVAVHGWSVDDPAEGQLVEMWAGLHPVGPGDSLPATAPRDDPEADRADRDGRADTALDEWLAPHLEQHPSVRVRRVSVHRHPASALLEEGRSASLLVVGNRGRGGFRGLLLGSVGMDLLREAPCPVAIVRY